MVLLVHELKESGGQGWAFSWIVWVLNCCEHHFHFDGHSLVQIANIETSVVMHSPNYNLFLACIYTMSSSNTWTYWKLLWPGCAVGILSLCKAPNGPLKLGMCGKYSLAGLASLVLSSIHISTVESRQMYQKHWTKTIYMDFEYDGDCGNIRHYADKNPIQNWLRIQKTWKQTEHILLRYRRNLAGLHQLCWTTLHFGHNWYQNDTLGYISGVGGQFA